MNSEKQDTQHFNISHLKLAVAIAVLRLKPAEMSGRKYTEMIQAQYLSSQTLLKTKMQTQQLQNQNANLIVPFQHNYAHINPEMLQHNDIPKISESSDMCTTGNYVDRQSSESETTHIASHFKASEEKLLRTTADSVKLNSLLEQESASKLYDGLVTPYEVDGCRDVCMLETSRFMHSVIELQGLARQQDPRLEKDLLLKSAVAHISTLRDVVAHDVIMLSESCMCKGAESVIMVTDSVPWIGDQAAFMQEVCTLVECIIAKLVQSSHFGEPQNIRQKRVMMKMLLIFMKGKILPLLCCILDSLVEFVETFCQKLKVSQLNAEAFDPDLFDNSWYVLNCLELTIQMWTKDNHVPVSILEETQAKLDNCLMQVTHSFPLVAHALAKTTSMIETILQNR